MGMPGFALDEGLPQFGQAHNILSLQVVVIDCCDCRYIELCAPQCCVQCNAIYKNIYIYLILWTSIYIYIYILLLAIPFCLLLSIPSWALAIDAFLGDASPSNPDQALASTECYNDDQGTWQPFLSIQ